MPIDPTPQCGAVTRELPEPEYPEPKPQAEEGRRPGRDGDDAAAGSDRPRVDPLTGAGEDIAG
jgi:hypothetical protein